MENENNLVDKPLEERICPVYGTYLKQKNFNIIKSALIKEIQSGKIECISHTLSNQKITTWGDKSIQIANLIAIGIVHEDEKSLRKALEITNFGDVVVNTITKIFLTPHKLSDN